MPRSSYGGAPARLDGEHLLVAACALAPACLDPTAFVARAWERPLSADRLVEVAQANQLRPETAAILDRAGTGPKPMHEAQRRLALVALAHQGHGRMLAAELGGILAALRGAGVRAMPFKGPAFEAWLGDPPGLREMGDLDIFIAASDLGRAVAALAPLGFHTPMPSRALESGWLARVTSELILERDADGTVLELHWRSAPGWYPTPVLVEDVFADAAKMVFLGEPIPWPAPELVFLVHVADALKSCGCGLRWLGDLTRIVRRGPLDWTRVRAVAGSRHGLANVRVALAVIVRVAEEVARELREPALALELPPPARSLAEEGERNSRSRSAAAAIVARLATDRRRLDARANLAWALQISDRPAHVALEVLRYLSGPAVADLKMMPTRGESDAALRYRAFRRRLANAA